MPAQSKQQQKFMGMVHALKKGEMDPKDASPELKKAAKSMDDKSAKDFAATKHKGLPRKVKQEIINRLKEYANKMGTDHLGGDDYTSSKKGGLRDNDGYDNVDYNKDMKMDESVFSTIDQIRQNSKNVKDFIKNVLSDKDFRDMKSDKDFIKYLGSIYEGKLPNNWMSGRTSDYHTQLRGKKREYDDTNFKKDNSGQPDLEEAGLKGVENIPSNKRLSKLSDNEKLNILQSSGNIISFHIPDWAKGRYKMWQVISAGKIKKQKDFDGDIIYFLPGKGPQKASPTYKSVKDLINGVDWDTMEMRRESVNEESQLKGYLAADVVDDIVKSIGLKFVSGQIKNTPNRNYIYLKLNDIKFGSGVIKMLKSKFGIDAKVDYFGGKGKFGSIPAVVFPSNKVISESFNELEHLKLLNLAMKTMPGSPKQKEIIKKLNQVRIAGGMKPLKEGDLEDVIHQVKKFDKPKDEKLLTIKVINKLKDKRNKSNSSFNKEKLQKMIDKIEGDYKKGKFLTEAPIFHAMNNPRFKKATKDLVKNKKVKNPETGNDVQLTTALKDKDHPAHNQAKSLFKRLFGEYASKQTLSYIPADEEEIEKMNEGTMIRRAVDIAQELLPKDTWSRFASDGKKNAEFVKNVVRDLTQSLNRFYKNHDISVRIKEEEGDSNVDMVLGVLSILRQIEDKENRQKVAVDMIKKFKEQNIDFDYKEFLELMKEYNK